MQTQYFETHFQLSIDVSMFLMKISNKIIWFTIFNLILMSIVKLIYFFPFISPIFYVCVCIVLYKHVLLLYEDSPAFQ